MGVVLVVVVVVGGAAPRVSRVASRGGGVVKTLFAFYVFFWICFKSADPPGLRVDRPFFLPILLALSDPANPPSPAGVYLPPSPLLGLGSAGAVYCQTSQRRFFYDFFILGTFFCPIKNHHFPKRSKISKIRPDAAKVIDFVRLGDIFWHQFSLHVTIPRKLIVCNMYNAKTSF